MTCSEDGTDKSNGDVRRRTHARQHSRQVGINNNQLQDLKVNNGCNGVSNGESLAPDAKLIGIDGYWYDITEFISRHPGGPVIEHFIGRDASAVFHGFHEKDVLKYRKPVGTFEFKADDRVSEAFSTLHKFFIKNGFFETSYKWYAMKLAVTFSLLAVAFFLVISCEQWYLHYIGAIFLAAFWQQCGFLMHDFMHNQGTHDRRKDSLLGTFFGTTCVGLSGSWWREEHFVHHALTNTVDYETNFSDPQMRQSVWAHNEKLFPFYKTYLEYLLIKIQHFTFIPICVVVGRAAITVDSFKQEARFREWIALGVHFAYVGFLLSYLPTWREIAIFYAIASACQGILHIQLLISHYAKPFFLEKDICNEQNWYLMQVLCNINIANPVWLDWFHGGLNFHIEHHLYPIMPRHNYRKASKYIKEVCKGLGITYDECTWSQAIVRTLKHLKTTSRHFKLDPR